MARLRAIALVVAIAVLAVPGAASGAAYVFDYEISRHMEFKAPEGVAVDSNDNAYIADTGHDRILKYTSAGGYLTEGGSTGSGDGQFVHPHDIAAAPGGGVWVVDSTSISQFTS